MSQIDEESDEDTGDTDDGMDVDGYQEEDKEEMDVDIHVEPQDFTQAADAIEKARESGVLQAGPQNQYGFYDFDRGDNFVDCSANPKVYGDEEYGRTSPIEGDCPEFVEGELKEVTLDLIRRSRMVEGKGKFAFFNEEKNEGVTAVLNR
ncbi:hypothetical protein RvY_01995 [Ramazzottius varieornatus]|uniref:Uncharacterized protein n=1 Tax=Ramazzottius varieornatus TaxID=947166 RepID=A0A1D1UIB2_RAMVA|nr:hypothetical protein RvY_01995 [Ramazzottius varieornatus]